MFARLLLVVAIGLVAWTLIAQNSQGAGSGRVYVVRTGDSLWSIATLHYGGDPREAVWRLRQRNGLGQATIHPGETLVLP